ncbi:MAG: hypothetical protein HYV96_16590 [Opitutae bacterium]|nr:hypothetical protein [Opitutae bacterium]
MNSNGVSLVDANGAVVPPCANGGIVAIGAEDIGVFAGAGACGDARPDAIAGFGTTAGMRAFAGARGACVAFVAFVAGVVGTTLRAGAAGFSSGAPRERARFGGGSTTHENGISEIAGRFSSGTNGVAVADETRRLISGGGTGGQLPPEGADTSPLEAGDPLAGGGV